MYIDKAKITLKSGNGGPGCISFRREDRTPKGGPNGGNGGNGGNIFIKGNKSINSLQTFRYKHRFCASNGQPGEGSDKDGKNGKNLVIEVPLGTMIYNENSVLLHDILNDQPVLLVIGGKGGIGNKYLATSIHRTPRFSVPHCNGVEKLFYLRMKTIGDIGLVGLPSAGKSSLLNILTGANAVTDNYDFTTLNPILGSMNNIIIVDIPGIIKDASQGKGLGLKFLQHIERCKEILYILDVNNNPINAFSILQKELSNYGIQKNFQVILNKIDLIDSDTLIQIKKLIPNTIDISIKNKIGIDCVIQKINLTQ